MPKPAIEFWFEFASTYSYPAAMTITDRASARGVHVYWKPFLLGPIFAAQGWRDSPFNLFPAKGRYMWMDLRRICTSEGLVFRKPEVFPQHSLAAARLALALMDQGLGPAFCRAVFDAQFAKGQDISDPGLISRLLSKVGAEGPAMVAKSQSQIIKQRLRDQVAEAQEAGIFGAPTFRVGDEIFWGFDRMEMALDRAAC